MNHSFVVLFLILIFFINKFKTFDQKAKNLSNFELTLIQAETTNRFITYSLNEFMDQLNLRNVSLDCSNQLAQWHAALNSKPPELWALKGQYKQKNNFDKTVNCLEPIIYIKFYRQSPLF